MNNYKIKLIFKYSDTVYVKAETEKEAIEQALAECEEQYECFYDVDVSEDTGA